MAGQRQPIQLLEAKGKKHLTKAEIEARRASEIQAPSDKVTAPKYLTAAQRKQFNKIVKQLKAIDLVTNLDVDALARLVVAMEKYAEITAALNDCPLFVTVERDGAEYEIVNGNMDRLAIMQDRYFKQCRQGAADFGLTVSSRCRLIIPKAPEAQPQNKFDKFA